MEPTGYILTGHTVVDKQHKVLFQLFDRCEKAIEEQNPLLVKAVIYDLIKYSLEHFRYEEESMIHLKYNQALYKEHVIQHALFKAKMVELTKHKDDVNVGVELLEFIRKWFIEHVTVTDQKFVDYYNEI